MLTEDANIMADDLQDSCGYFGNMDLGGTK
jgi:hypothetical protein